jgi:hypothetical protein
MFPRPATENPHKQFDCNSFFKDSFAEWKRPTPTVLPEEVVAFISLDDDVFAYGKTAQARTLALIAATA